MHVSPSRARTPSLTAVLALIAVLALVVIIVFGCEYVSGIIRTRVQ